MSSSGGWKRLYWPLVALFAVCVYAYALDGLYIPHIGDEAPYIEIARLTAESGRWLPLETAPGLENTKPPGLFWLGVVSTSWAESFTLWRLRFPILLCTLLTAALVLLVARRITGELRRPDLPRGPDVFGILFDLPVRPALFDEPSRDVCSYSLDMRWCSSLGEWRDRLVGVGRLPVSIGRDRVPVQVVRSRRAGRTRVLLV